mgnify:CR=1 FL=1
MFDVREYVSYSVYNMSPGYNMNCENMYYFYYPTNKLYYDFFNYLAYTI